MKNYQLIAVMLSAILAVSVACGDSADTDPPETVDLSGAWVGFGYECDDPELPQLIEIEQDDEGLLATKIVGDNCVGDGEETFRYDFDEVGPNTEDTIAGETRVYNRSSGDMRWASGKLIVDSDDRFRLVELDSEEDEIILLRTSTADLDEAALTGTWYGHGYGCNGYEDAQEIEITEDDGTWTATKVTGDDCIGAGETTWTTDEGGTSFAITFHALDGSGEPIEVDSRGDLLAEDYLFVDYDDGEATLIFTRSMP